ncbi:MAG: hypothetical protein KDK07_08045 [Bauldia sp.]|nr:hypothetical protein [Bauldia sp.]
MPALEFHPLANLFPLIEGEAFEDLVASIREDGFRSGEEIVLLEGKILDGRNRYRALEALVAAGELPAAEIEPTSWLFVKFESEGLDGLFSPEEIARGPLAYVLAKNLHRRHLTESQRAMIAAEIATLQVGRPSSENRANLRDLNRAEAATLLGVSERSVTAAKSVVDQGAPEVVEAVRQGKASVSAAEAIARLPVEEQRRIVESADPKAIKAAAKRIRAEEQAAKKERRQARERTLGELQAPTGRYGVIVEDYEWDFEVWSRDSGMDRHAANHYPVSADAHSAEEIVKRTADRLAVADDNCLLAMWATVPHLAIAIDVLRLRGFRYVSSYAWGKDRAGTGHWNRNKHEILLLGVKGEIPCPAAGTQWESLIMAPVGPHSAKPEAFLEMLEQYFPTLPKIELNARRRRPGWAAWGFDAPDAEQLAIEAAGGAEVAEEGDRFVTATVDGVTAIVDMIDGAIHAVRFNEPFPSESGFHSFLTFDSVAGGRSAAGRAAAALRHCIGHATDRKANSFARGLIYPDETYQLDEAGELVSWARGSSIAEAALPVDRVALLDLITRWDGEPGHGSRKKGELPRSKHGNRKIVALGEIGADGWPALEAVDDYPVAGRYLICESYRRGERTWRLVEDGAALDQDVVAGAEPLDPYLAGIQARAAAPAAAPTEEARHEDVIDRDVALRAGAAGSPHRPAAPDPSRPAARAPHPSRLAPLAPQDDDDGLEIPNFLRRGHPDCEAWRGRVDSGEERAAG